MTSELWELVEGHSLEVGDVVKVGCEYPPQTIEIIDDNGWIPTPGFSIAPHDTVFRRIPDTEDPRVLRRLLDNIARDEGWSREAVACWIEETRMELESEAGNE